MHGGSGDCWIDALLAGLGGWAFIIDYAAVYLVELEKKTGEAKVKRMMAPGEGNSSYGEKEVHRCCREKVWDLVASESNYPNLTFDEDNDGDVNGTVYELGVLRNQLRKKTKPRWLAHPTKHVRFVCANCLCRVAFCGVAFFAHWPVLFVCLCVFTAFGCMGGAEHGGADVAGV
tara:strand:+ start:347 stop:868 length:522 start_codon:yes stop_codon:yes gene_type:complete